MVRNTISLFLRYLTFIVYANVFCFFMLLKYLDCRRYAACKLLIRIWMQVLFCLVYAKLWVFDIMTKIHRKHILKISLVRSWVWGSAFCNIKSWDLGVAKFSTVTYCLFIMFICINRRLFTETELWVDIKIPWLHFVLVAFNLIGKFLFFSPSVIPTHRHTDLINDRWSICKCLIQNELS